MANLLRLAMSYPIEIKSNHNQSDPKMMFWSFFFSELDDDEQPGEIIEYLNILPATTSMFKGVGYLGQGDEGTVTMIKSGNNRYAMKTYKRGYGGPNEIIWANKVLNQIGVAPRIWYIGAYCDGIEQD